MQHEERTAKFSFTVIVDGKRALSGAEKGKEIGQWARQAPHSPPVIPGPELTFDRRWSPISLDNPDGARSSLRQATVQVADKVHSIPTVRNGQFLEGPDAIKAAEAEGWDKFPSYANHDQAEARYGQMHDFMDKDAQAYFADRPGQGRQIQMTPQIGKASVEATAPPKDTGGERVAPVTPPVDALPVRPAAPQMPIAPAAPLVQTTAELPQGNAPQQLVDASQGNMTMLGFAPQPVDQTSKADAIDRRRLAVAGPLAGGAGLGLVAVKRRHGRHEPERRRRQAWRRRRRSARHRLTRQKKFPVANVIHQKVACLAIQSGSDGVFGGCDRGPAAICDSGGVNSRSRGVCCRLACWPRLGRHQKYRCGANRRPPPTISHCRLRSRERPAAERDGQRRCQSRRHGGAHHHAGSPR